MLATIIDENFDVIEQPSHRLRDGIMCLPGGLERVRWRGETLWYLGRAHCWPMLVVAREAGDRLLVHPLDCETAEGED